MSYIPEQTIGIYTAAPLPPAGLKALPPVISEDKKITVPRPNRFMTDDQISGGAIPATPVGEAGAQQSWTFLDFLDIINPLQNIPVVSTIYRTITGDEMKPELRVAGGALYGGPIGAAVGLVDCIVQKSSGKDMGQTVMAMLGHKTAAPDNIQVASHQEIIWDKPADTVQTASADTHQEIIWDKVADNSVPDTQLLPPPHHAPTKPGRTAADDNRPKTGPNSGFVATRTGTDLAFSRVEPAGGGEEGHSPSRLKADSPMFLLKHDALAEEEEAPLPSRQIAFKMMEALDKYQALVRERAPK